MGEKEPSYHTESLNQHLKQTPEQVAPSNEAATVQDSSKQQQKRQSVLSAEIYTKTPEKRVLKTPARPSPLLKTIGDLYIAKEVLGAKIEDLQAENQKLKDKEERRKEKDRKSSLDWQKTHREEYNAYKREYMREYRAKKKQ